MNISNRSRYDRLISNAIIAFLLFSVLHYCFRYIFRFSDSGTSLGYSDTPLYLSVLKDVALLTFLIYAIFNLLISKIVKSYPIKSIYVSLILFVITIILIAASIVKFYFFRQSLDVVINARTLWFPILFLSFTTLFQVSSPNTLIFRWAKMLLPLMMFFWIYTIAMYVFFSRLPALSYPDSLRFGGVLDDPNGYGALCVLVLAILWNKIAKIYVLLIIVNILMTVSLSSYTVLLVFLFLVLLERIALMRTKFLIISSLLSTLAMLSIFSFVYLNYDSIVIWWENKSRSVGQRTIGLSNALVTVDDYGFYDWIFGTKGFTESQLSLTLLNSGIIGLLFQIALAIIVIYINVKSRDEMSRRIGFWGIAILISSFFVPYLYVYPISIIFWSFLGMSAMAIKMKGKSV